MFTIRNEQMQAFSEAATKNFEVRMVAHLRQFFPERCAPMGEEEVRQEIRCGIERAATYGIVAERDVCHYIKLMFGLGRDFDRDSKLPWAQNVLTDKVLKDPATRIKHLYGLMVHKAGIGARKSG